MTDRIKTLHFITVFILIIGTVLWIKPPNMMSTFVFTYFLTLLAINDWERLKLPASLIVGLAFFGFVHTFIYRIDQLIWHLLASIFGFFLFTFIARFYHKRTGEQYLGRGDARLMVGLGAWLGPMGMIHALALGSVGGLAFMVINSILNRHWDSKTKIPFGAFLCLAGWLVWLIGPFNFTGTM